MTEKLMLKEAVKCRLRELEPYKTMTENQRYVIVERVLLCEDRLLPNLLEWTKKIPLSDIWVNDKYCVGAVMKIRRDDDFVAAFIALDDYAKSSDSEPEIWRRWS